MKIKKIKSYSGLLREKKIISIQVQGGLIKEQKDFIESKEVKESWIHKIIIFLKNKYEKIRKNV